MTCRELRKELYRAIRMGAHSTAEMIQRELSGRALEAAVPYEDPEIPATKSSILVRSSHGRERAGFLHRRKGGSLPDTMVGDSEEQVVQPLPPQNH